MSRHQLLKETLGSEKRLTRLVACTKKCPLAFCDLLVYSTLIYRGTEGKSVSGLSALTGLHRCHTLPKILTRLANCGLVAMNNNHWCPISPQSANEAWFAMAGTCETLSDQFRYNWIAVPAANSPLTVMQAAVLSFCIQGYTPVQTARFLRISARTVSRAIALAQKDETTGTFTIKRDWFQDKGAAVVNKAKGSVEKGSVEKGTQSVTKSLAERLGIGNDITARSLTVAVESMLAADLTDKQITQFWNFVVQNVGNGDGLDDILWGFPTKCKELNGEHKHNLKQGKYHGNCYKLLYSHYDERFRCR